MEQHREEEKKLLFELMTNIQQTMSDVDQFSEKMDKFKDEVEELISCMVTQYQQFEDLLEEITEDRCSECGDITKSKNVYEIITPKKKKMFLCKLCYVRYNMR